MAEYYLPEKHGGWLFRLWHNSVPPMKRGFREHRHIYFEIGYFKSGRALYRTAEGEYTVEAGDMFIFPSNKVHSITEIFDGANLEFTNIHFEPSYVMGDRSGLSYNNIGICFSGGALKTVKPNGELKQKLCDLFLQIEAECERGEPEYVAAVHNKLCEMLILLVRNSENSMESGVGLRAVRRALFYIDKHLSEQISLADISKSAGLSQNYMSALFHETTGITMWEYIVKKRVETAIRLISTRPELNIIEVASMCGFNNTANFNKAFRKYADRKPADYREFDLTEIY